MKKYDSTRLGSNDDCLHLIFERNCRVSSINFKTDERARIALSNTYLILVAGDMKDNFEKPELFQLMKQELFSFPFCSFRHRKKTLL